MKLALITLSILFLSTRLFAQNIELSIQAGSGLFHYAGNATASTTFVSGYGSSFWPSTINNPYGNKNGFSYGGAIQAQHVSSGGFIAGVQGGYDVLRSIVDINKVYYPFFIGGGYTGTPAKGQTALQSQNFNINPYLGYRLNLKKIKLDIMPGMDVSFNVNTYEKESITASDSTVKVDNKMPKSPTDIRLKLGLAAWYKRFGLTAGYAHGLTNFASNLDVNAGGTSTPAPNIHSELIRFGISYRIF